MRQDKSPTTYHQMELGDRRAGEARLTPEQMREQMENARRQAEFYEAQRAQWEEQQAALEESNEQKHLFIDSLNDIGMRIHNAVNRIEREQVSMKRELQEVEQTGACLRRHLEILSSLRPHTWPANEFARHLHEALPKLERAENDFHEAYVGAEQFRHTTLFLDKPGEERKSAFHWSVLGMEMAKGLAFHLPLFLLLLLTWLVYWAVTSF